MDERTVRSGIKLVNKRAEIEISGNVNIYTIKNLARLEIDYISVDKGGVSPAKICADRMPEH